MQRMENKNLERYGTIASWADDLGISRPTLESKLKIERAIIGKTSRGILRPFYSESYVREALQHLFMDKVETDETGFFMEGSERLGNLDAWQKETGMSRRTLTSGMDASRMRMAKGNQGMPCAFYPESAFANLREDRDSLPITDEEGFVTPEDGTETLGTACAWKRKLDVDYDQTMRRLLAKQQGIPGILAANNRKITLYRESVVRQIVENFSALQIADETGFFQLDGMRYGTMGAFVRLHDLEHNMVKKRCAALVGIDGRSPTGQVLPGKFFKESDMCEACKDLIPVSHGK